MRQAGEPTVEEILDSIKKVIARDNRAVAEGRSRSALAEEADRVDDLCGDAEDVLDLGEAAEIADPGADGGDALADAPMLGEEARSSMRDSLAALAMLAEPGAPPQIVRSGETSLESMARDLLRPALAEWLEKNLPVLVERMVAQEIARIVGKRG